MKTIYYSEVLKRQFNTEEECLAAEKLYQEKVLAKQAAEDKAKEEKATRAKEIEKAYKEFKDAEKAYVESSNRLNKLRNAFVKDYGKFHMTVSEETPLIEVFEDLINHFFR